MAAVGHERTLRRLALERAAVTYDGAALLQREVGSRLLDRLEVLSIEVETVCDLGCGTGSTTRHLFKKLAGARIVGVDLAAGMLAVARRRQPLLRRLRCVCADIAQLPLRDSSVDLLFSNLALHWCMDLDAALAESRRVLRSGGAFLFTTFGPDTLHELRASWTPSGHSEAGATLLDMHDVGDALVRAGFVEPVMDVEHITIEYQGVATLIGDLRAMGERNLSPNRRRTLTGRGRLTGLAANYERFRRDGVLPATFEVVYGMAWGARRGTSPKVRSDGTATVPVAAIRRRLREAPTR